MQKTTWKRKEDVERKWHLVDVKGQILGRVATQIASLLKGKHKVDQVPNVDMGDYVVVINAKDVKLTRGKEKKKMYYSHSQFPGGFKEVRFDKLIAEKPTMPITKAVRNMLPANKLRDGMMLRLFVYEGPEHKNAGQNPEEYKLNN
jgi:large subunit ribosomal protein L13